MIAVTALLSIVTTSELPAKLEAVGLLVLEDLMLEDLKIQELETIIDVIGLDVKFYQNSERNCETYEALKRGAYFIWKSLSKDEQIKIAPKLIKILPLIYVAK